MRPAGVSWAEPSSTFWKSSSEAGPASRFNQSAPSATTAAVITRVRQATLLTYEPLLFLVAVYLCLSGILIFGLRWLEGRVPTGR